MFSPTCQYAIRALTYLAMYADKGPVLAREIAAAEDIPPQFLSKILHQLGLQGLVRSQKGPGGGFALARPAAKITIDDISEAVDGSDHVARGCVLGLSECRDATGCALHEDWKAFQTQYERTIACRTLAELAGAGRAGKSRTPSRAAPSKKKKAKTSAAKKR